MSEQEHPPAAQPTTADLLEMIRALLQRVARLEHAEQRRRQDIQATNQHLRSRG